MSLCPVCGRALCDHTAVERGQTFQEMMRPLSKEETQAFRENPSDSEIKIAVGRKHAHDPA